ncbi:MAG: ATP phosphoribosyltransferase regulatory subunit [Candidatus Saccharibacteria bacterium]|nr:ATP phosphoribosyltransferase regulatory subunit [Candidatus Saccharibacteria bacterium]
MDRMHKMATPAFTAQVENTLSPTQRDDGALDKLLAFLKADSLEHLPESVRSHQSVDDLKRLMRDMEGLNITNAVFDPTLMRGFDYYTDIAFEVFDTDPQNNRSMFGGGRYDGLVGAFGVDPIPTIGFGMGGVALPDFTLAWAYQGNSFHHGHVFVFRGRRSMKPWAWPN